MTKGGKRAGFDGGYRLMDVALIQIQNETFENW